ncbi:MAG: hypothetical protein M1438_10105 [Deltaproteobacteria bacterium]|nr:hypothetical protein [Deltaproteobacteria bacterium]
MERSQIYQQIEEMFGVVPAFFKAIPDASLEMEWQLFKRVQFEAGPIPNKYRELIKSSLGWSTYLNGLQFDLEQFKGEVRQACEYVRAQRGGAQP